MVGGQEMMLMAESPRKTVFFNTSKAVGQSDIEVREQGQSQKSKFRNISLNLVVQKHDLQKGEQTKLKVVVKGLENLQEDIPLRLQNQSTSIMTMEGGNVQTINIRPADVKPGGIYETELTLTGIQLGAFLIEGAIIWDKQ